MIFLHILVRKHLSLVYLSAKLLRIPAAVKCREEMCERLMKARIEMSVNI